ILVPGPERAVSQPQFGPAAGSQYGTSLASNGSEFVVAWLTNLHGFAARLGSNGQLIDETGSPLALQAIPTQFAGTSGPFVAGVGDHFLAVGWDGSQIRAERLNTDLTIASTHELGFPGTPSMIALQGDARSALLVLDVGGRVIGRLLDANAAPIGDWFDLGSVDAPGHMALIRDASSYLLLIAKPWEASLYGRRIAPDGTVASWKKIEGAAFTDLDVLRAAAAGSKDVVAWHALHARDLNLSVIDPDTLTATEPLFLAMPARIDTLFAREGIATVVYADGSAIAEVQHAKTVDLTTRNVIADRVLPTYSGVDPSAAASVGDTDVLATFTSDGSQSHVAALAFSRGVPVGAPVIVSRSASEQMSPRVAFGNSDGFAVWEENGIRGVRITRDGTPLDAQPIEIGPGAAPSVAFDGQRFVVVWTAPAGVVARRIDESGVAVDAQPLVIDSNIGGAPSIACGPDDCLVAWLGGNGTRSATLQRNGTVGPTVQLANDQGGGAADRMPDVAYGGGRFAVTWLTAQWAGGPSPFYTGVSVSFVAPSGSPAGRIWLRDLIAGAPIAGTPKIAWNGSEFLAAWMMGGSLYVRHFDVNGAPLAPPQSVAAPDPHGAVRDVAFVNGSWIVALDPTSINGSAPPRSYLVELSPSLATNFQFTFSGDVAMPALSSDGTPLVVYSRVADELPYGGAYRVFVSPLVQEPAKRRAVARR
ncbi:MAG TPA: hypothetical protein VLU46_16945, partial [Thermoanaerobaculia bacterium]|nr:hypothetical protein [Thermoanaerobaculia bacterium]